MQPEPSTHLESDGVDLRPVLNALIRRWRMVRDLTLAAALAALVVIQLTPHTYKATAVVALLRSASEVQYQNQIKTVSPDALPGQAGTATANSLEVRNTLAALVNNPRIAEQVIHDLGGQLPLGLRNPNVLVGLVRGSAGANSNTVNIVVQADQPGLAMKIANAWAAGFETYANRTYSGVPMADSSFQSELAAAKADYDKANRNLVNFTAQDREDQIQRQIDERKQLIDSLQKGRQAAIAKLIEQRTQAEANYVGKYMSSVLDLAGQPLTMQAQAQVEKLGMLYAAKAHNDWLLEAATTLRSNLGRPGASATNTVLALELLKAELVSNPRSDTSVSTGRSGGLPGNLQVNLGTPSSTGENLKAESDDLDALISALQSRQRDLDGQIAKQREVMTTGGGVPTVGTAAGGVASPMMLQAQKLATNLAQLDGIDQAVGGLNGSDAVSKTMDRLSAEIMGLQSELIKDGATKQELTHQRDLTYKTYTSLQAKAQEMAVAAQLPSSEVVFAVPASFPYQSIEAGHRARTIGIAVALGVIAGAFLALVLDYLAPAAPTPAVPWTAPLRWVLGTVGRWRSKQNSKHLA